MNQEYALSGSNQDSMFSSLKNITGTQKIIAAFVIALVVIAIAYFVYTKWYATDTTKTETFMMPSTTMRHQVAYFPEAMTNAEANATCGVASDEVEEAYAWAQSEIKAPGEPMSGRKTDNALSRSLQGY